MPREKKAASKPKKKRSKKDRTLDEKIQNDPLLGLRGSGRELWADEHADEYVHRLREGWE